MMQNLFLRVPQMLYDQGIMDSIFTKFGKVGMVNTSANWDAWNEDCAKYGES